MTETTLTHPFTYEECLILYRACSAAIEYWQETAARLEHEDDDFVEDFETATEAVAEFRKMWVYLDCTMAAMRARRVEESAASAPHAA